MKKGQKRLLAVIALFLLVAVSYSTYAIYKSSATGTATAKAAAWVVKVNNTDIVTKDTYTFSTSDITWDNTASGAAEGTIAPGSTGTIKVLIDATGSQVPVDYSVAIGTVTAGSTTISNSNFAVSVDDSTGTIAYSDSSMKKEVTLKITWTAEDSSAANTADLALAGQTISIPVTVTVSQHLNK